MENKNNGRGIFYGVIGVATLVVAIIGATFAYFSATITQNNAINVGSTTVRLEVGTTQSNFKTDIIPVDTIKTVKDEDTGEESEVPVEAFYLYPGFGSGTGKGTCTDDKGNSICSIYQIEVKNPAETKATQTIKGALTPVANSGFSDLQYAVFSGPATSITSYAVHGAESAASQSGTGKLIHKGAIGSQDAVNKEQEWRNSSVELQAGQSTIYTIVVWLEDTGIVQNEQQGKLFTASLRFFSAEGSEVTGVISGS